MLNLDNPARFQRPGSHNNSACQSRFNHFISSSNHIGTIMIGNRIEGISNKSPNRRKEMHLRYPSDGFFFLIYIESKSFLFPEVFPHQRIFGGTGESYIIVTTIRIAGIVIIFRFFP